MAWTIPQITAELKLLPTWKKKFYWWPTQRWVLQDTTKRAFCREAARLSQSMGIGIHPTSYVDTVCVEAAIQTIQGLPAWVEWCITGLPFTYVAGSDSTYDWGTKHDQDLAFWLKGLKDNLTYLKTRQQALGMTNKVGCVFFDTEVPGIYPNGDPAHDKAAADKLGVYYRETKQVCLDTLGYAVPVVHYGHGAMDLSTNWRKAAPIPFETLGDAYCQPLYQWQDPHLCVETYNRALAALKAGNAAAQLAPCVCLNGGYVRDFNSWPNAQQWPSPVPWVIDQEYPRLGSWLAGRYINWSDYYSNDECGRFDQAPYGFFWPGMLPMDTINGVDTAWKYWPVHFLSFARGAANIATLPEGSV